MKNEEKKLLLRLANLLEEDNIAICSRKRGEYTEVFFMKDGKEYFTLHRTHNTAYDIRGACGMSSEEANAFYHTRRSVFKKYTI